MRICMRLFHVSEEANIEVFEPRVPVRSDLWGGEGLVWAVNEKCLPNYLTPRDCPRVTWHIGPNTTLDDIDRFISSPSCPHVVAIEHRWFRVFPKTTLYLYEFETDDFREIDRTAGYYVSRFWEKPISVTRIDDLFDALFEAKVELRVVDSLEPLAELIRQTSFDWSMIRMANARPAQ